MKIIKIIINKIFNKGDRKKEIIEKIKELDFKKVEWILIKPEEMIIKEIE